MCIRPSYDTVAEYITYTPEQRVCAIKGNNYMHAMNENTCGKGW